MFQKNCKYIFPLFHVPLIGKYRNSFEVWINDTIRIFMKHCSEIVVQNVTIYKNPDIKTIETIHVFILFCEQRNLKCSFNETLFQ